MRNFVRQAARFLDGARQVTQEAFYLQNARDRKEFDARVKEVFAGKFVR